MAASRPWLCRMFRFVPIKTSHYFKQLKLPFLPKALTLEMDGVQETRNLVFHYCLKLKQIRLGCHAKELISFPNGSQVPVLKPRPRNHQSREQASNAHGSAMSGRVRSLHGTESCCLCVSRPRKRQGDTAV